MEATCIRELRQIFHAYVLDREARRLIDEGDFGGLRTRDAALFQSVRSLGPERLRPLLDYVRANVPLESFAVVA